MARGPEGCSVHLGKESCRDDYKATQDHRRESRDLRLQIELVHTQLQSSLKIVSTPASLLRIDTGIHLAGLFLKL
jgi:hypothetical protein